MTLGLFGPFDAGARAGFGGLYGRVGPHGLLDGLLDREHLC